MSLKKLKSIKGFTLIELMIVVAIIGILAAIAIPKFADMVTKSKEASVKGNLGAVRSAVSIYYGDMEGENPGNLHTALTTQDKYLPSANGLGNFSLPKNGAGNPGHSSNPTLAANVTQAATIATAVTDAGGLYYVVGGIAAGQVNVSCTHRDAKNIIWSSY